MVSIQADQPRLRAGHWSTHLQPQHPGGCSRRTISPASNTKIKRDPGQGALLLLLLLLQKNPFQSNRLFPDVAGSPGSPLSNPSQLLSSISWCLTCVLQGSRGQFGRCETAVRFCWRRDSHMYTGRSCRSLPHVVSGPTRCHRNYCTYCICASFLHAFS